MPSRRETPRAGQRTRVRPRADWTRLRTEELLDVRLCDLGLSIEGTALEGRVDRLQRELARAGLPFRPYVWLSTDWFTPDGLTGFAVPFYLAHPRLARLEHRMMLEVEGGTRDACMRLLRHETGHAIDNAYRLRRKRRWRETFGSPRVPYLEDYSPRPGSRKHVLNLPHWYAQSHPVEDFAETFAVWLQPGSRWRARYASWPALEKLYVVDEMMRDLSGLVPPVRTRVREDPVGSLRTTLREHYEEKRARYEVEAPSSHDRFLQRVFAPDHGDSRTESAAAFLRRWRGNLRRRIASVTGQHPYLVDQVLQEMIPRCRVLGLRRARPESETLVDTSAMLAALTHGMAMRSDHRYSR